MTKHYRLLSAATLGLLALLPAVVSTAALVETCAMPSDVRPFGAPGKQGETIFFEAVRRDPVTEEDQLGVASCTPSGVPSFSVLSGMGDERVTAVRVSRQGRFALTQGSRQGDGRSFANIYALQTGVNAPPLETLEAFPVPIPDGRSVFFYAVTDEGEAVGSSWANDNPEATQPLRCTAAKCQSLDVPGALIDSRSQTYLGNGTFEGFRQPFLLRNESLYRLGTSDELNQLSESGSLAAGFRPVDSLRLVMFQLSSRSSQRGGKLSFREVLPTYDGSAITGFPLGVLESYKRQSNGKNASALIYKPWSNPGYRVWSVRTDGRAATDQSLDEWFTSELGSPLVVVINGGPAPITEILGVTQIGKTLLLSVGITGGYAVIELEL